MPNSFSPLSAKISKVKVILCDLMWSYYHFSISLTCGYAFRHGCRNVFSCRACPSFGT